MKKLCFFFSCEHQHLNTVCFNRSLPFLKEKASDELTYAQDVIEFLSHMGTQIRSDYE